MQTLPRPRRKRDRVRRYLGTRAKTLHHRQDSDAVELVGDRGTIGTPVIATVDRAGQLGTTIDPIIVEAAVGAKPGSRRAGYMNWVRRC